MSLPSQGRERPGDLRGRLRPPILCRKAQIPAEEDRVNEHEHERDSEDAPDEEETKTDPEVAEEESKAAERNPLSEY
jgi:hypothetical protein